VQALFIAITRSSATAVRRLTVRPDVRSVMHDVAPIARHIVAIVIATGRLRRRLPIVGSGR